MNQTSRWALRVGALVLLAATAFVIEVLASQHPNRNMLELTAAVRGGVYGRERSAEFPGPNGLVSQEYRWTEANSELLLWPPLPSSGVLELAYLIPPPLGTVWLRIGSDRAIALSEARSLRTLHLLLAPVKSTTIRLTQTAPALPGTRQLGFIISYARWWTLTPATWAGTSQALWRAAGGLPLTMVLVGGLGLLVGLSQRRRFALMALVVGGTAMLALRSSWDSRAMQPALQALAGYAIVGLSIVWLGRRVGLRSGPGLIVSLWVLSWLIFFQPLIYSDGVGYYAFVRSVFVDGDLLFDNELDPTQTPLGAHDVPMGYTATGYVHNPWSVGPAIIWTPFWLVAHGLTLAGQSLGLDWVADGYARPYIVLVTLASALAGLATMLGSLLIARRWFTEPVAVLTAITLYFGSNLLFYAQYDGSFAHSLSAATVTWFALAVLRLDDDPVWRRWLMLGLAVGTMLLTYWITALLLVAPLLLMLQHGWRRLARRDWNGLLRLGLGVIAAASIALLVFVPQMLAWRLMYGSWLVTPQGQAFITPENIRLAAVLFSPLRGIAWWTPAYFVGLIGSIWFAWCRPRPGLALLAAITIFLLYNSSLQDWHGSGAFGMRRLTAIAPFLSVGLAALFDSMRRQWKLMLGLASLLIGWSMRMTVRYLSETIPHDAHSMMEYDLRAILFTPEPFPLASFVTVARQGWIGTLLQKPTVSEALILGVCVIIISAALLIVGPSYRRRLAQPLTRIQQPGCRQDGC